MTYKDKNRWDWTQRDLFEYEVDMVCSYHSWIRYRSSEWVAFTERFVPFFEDWNGCWVAEEAWREFTLYLTKPEGEYEPMEYPEGHSFLPARFGG